MTLTIVVEMDRTITPTPMEVPITSKCIDLDGVSVELTTIILAMAMVAAHTLAILRANESQPGTPCRWRRCWEVHLGTLTIIMGYQITLNGRDSLTPGQCDCHEGHT